MNRLSVVFVGLTLALVSAVALPEARAGWKENQLKQASDIERDRANRLRENEKALRRAKNPGVKKYAAQKVASLKKTAGVLAVYRAAINANDKVKAARAREALHLMRLEVESMNTQIELHVSRALYAAFGGAVKGEMLGHLDGLLAASDKHTASFDPVIRTLVSGAK